MPSRRTFAVLLLVASCGGGAAVPVGETSSPPSSEAAGSGGSAAGRAGAAGEGGASSGMAGAAAGSSGSAGVPSGGTAGTGAAGGAPSACANDDVSTWKVERFRDQGDYERAVAATSGVPWIAIKPKAQDLVLATLSLDPTSGIVLANSTTVPGAAYPAALDVDDTRFVVLTSSGINWNGDITLWRVDRADGTVLSVPIGSPPTDPAYTANAAVALAGDAIVVAYSRVADQKGVVEIRDDQLEVLASQTVAETSFVTVRASQSAVDVYAGKSLRVHAEAGQLAMEPVDPAWQAFGGLDATLVQIGAQIRMVDGGDVWSAAWPDTQISPPAVVRKGGGRTAFSLETELTPVIGHVAGSDLAWISIVPTADSPGTGVQILPLVDGGRLGVFYLGLEIPSPMQPLRYYGVTCP